MPPRPPSRLSASRLSCYKLCPQLFYERYVLKRAQAPSVERQFGTAVHRGLEAYFRGQDWEMAYLLDWRKSARECTDAGLFVPSSLTSRGLEMIEQVIELGLQGEPEHLVSVIHPSINIPFIGYVDLWSDGRIYDFKTTAFGWTQHRADGEVFQPAIYSQAYADERGIIPEFEYIVMARAGGPAQRFSGTRTADQIIEAFDQARQIYELIEAGRFDCCCGQKFCGQAAA